MKKILIVLVLILSSCRAYQLQQTDKCCDTEVIYLEDVKSGTTVFSALDFKTITLDFRPSFYRSSDLYWYHNYGYMGSRPLWMDFDFHFGNYYSFYSPYYSFNRPWNYWDWYMRPWRPYQHNQWAWNNGPFNNQGYNVVWNSGRQNNNVAYINGPRGNRNNIISNNIENRIVNNKSRVVVNKPLVNDPNFVIEEDGVRWFSSSKPVINKPVINKTKPVRNNNKPIIRNNNRPIHNNSRPAYNNSRPAINNNSRSSNNSRSTTVTKSRGGKNN